MTSKSIGKYVGAAAIALSALYSTSSHAAACPTFHTLTNGTTADATKVMDNFNNVLCAPNFSGPVGIGTSSPAGTLHTVTGASGYGIIITGSSSHNLLTFRSSSTPNTDAYVQWLNATNDLNFHDIGTGVVMTLKDGGNIGMGTMTPVGKLQVVANPAGYGMVIQGPTGTNLLTFRNSSAPNTDTYIQYLDGNDLRFWDNGTGVVATFKDGGNVGIGTTSPSYLLHVNGTAYATGAAGALSDIRHKNAIAALKPGALDAVMRLRPVSYRWNEPKDDGMKGTQLGFIAQEVEKVFPSVVLTQDNEEKTKGLKYNELIPVLTKALQEMKAVNDRQAARITELDAENRRLAERLSSRLDRIERQMQVRTASASSVGR